MMTKNKRIAYCIPALYNSGGMERVLSVKANYLAERGYEIHIITTDQMGRGIYFPLHPSMQTHHIDLDYEGSNGLGLKEKLKAFFANQPKHKKALRALLERIQPDLTISMFGHEAGFLPSIKAGGTKVLEYHFSKLKRLQYGRTGLWRIVDQWRTWQDERIVRRYDHFVVLTEEDKALWGDMPNISVIPNPKPFESDVTSPLTEKRVLAAGRYCHQKNFEELLHIWQSLSSRHPDWQLAIYGNGEARPELEALATRLGITNSVHLAMPTSDMHSVYMQSSIYAMTSRYEGLPMVLIEAQTMGLPIVSYACKCGPRDIITEGKDGFVIEEGDRESFARALEALMNNEELRHEMGTVARSSSEHYDIDRIMTSWLAIIEH